MTIFGVCIQSSEHDNFTAYLIGLCDREDLFANKIKKVEIISWEWNKKPFALSRYLRYIVWIVDTIGCGRVNWNAKITRYIFQYVCGKKYQDR